MEARKFYVCSTAQTEHIDNTAAVSDDHRQKTVHFQDEDEGTAFEQVIPLKPFQYVLCGNVC